MNLDDPEMWIHLKFSIWNYVLHRPNDCESQSQHPCTQGVTLGSLPDGIRMRFLGATTVHRPAKVAAKWKLWQFEAGWWRCTEIGRLCSWCFVTIPKMNGTSLPHGLLLMGIESLVVRWYSRLLGGNENMWKPLQCSAQGSWEAHDLTSGLLTSPLANKGICKW